MPNIEESNVAFISEWPPPKKKQRVNSSSGSFHVVSVQHGIEGPRASSETASGAPACRAPADLNAAPRAKKTTRVSPPPVGDATDRWPTKRSTPEPDKGVACPWNSSVPFNSQDPAMVRAIPLPPSGKYKRQSVCKVDSPVVAKEKQNRRHTLPHFREKKSTCELDPFHRPNVEERETTSGSDQLDVKRERQNTRESGPRQLLSGEEEMCTTVKGGSTHLPQCDEGEETGTNGSDLLCLVDNKERNGTSDLNQLSLPNVNVEIESASKCNPLQLFCDVEAISSSSEWGSPQLPNDKEVNESTDESNLLQPPNVKERKSSGEYDRPWLPEDKEVRKSTSKCDVQHSPYVKDVNSSGHVSLCWSKGKEDRKSANKNGSLHWSNVKLRRKRKIELGPLDSPSEKEERTSSYDPRDLPTEKRERSKPDPLQSLHDKEAIDTSSASYSSQSSKDKDERESTLSGMDPLHLFSGKEVRKSNGGKGSSHLPREKVRRKSASGWDSPDVKERKSTKKCQTAPVFNERKSAFGRLQPHVPNFKERMSACGLGSPHLSNFTEERKSPSKWSPPVSNGRKSAMECGLPRLGLPNFRERTSSGESSPLHLSPNYAVSKEGTGYTNSLINEIPNYEHSIFQDVEFIGDSMLLRLFTHITGMKPPPSNQPGKAWYKLTVGGQTLAHSLKKLKCLKSRNQLPTTKRIIVMLGTNNILNNTQLNEMKWQLRQIVHMLTARCSNVIVLTIPPIPRLDNTRNPVAWKRLCAYNLFILQELEGEKVSIMDIFPLFMDNEEVRKHLFERFMGYGIYKRPDEIHWNLEGIAVVHKAICNAGLL